MAKDDIYTVMAKEREADVIRMLEIVRRRCKLREIEGKKIDKSVKKYLKEFEKKGGRLWKR